jgi:hypothetical protein
MNIGDKVSFSFAKNQKEGKIIRITDKRMVIEMETPKKKKRIVKRNKESVK